MKPTRASLKSHLVDSDYVDQIAITGVPVSKDERVSLLTNIQRWNDVDRNELFKFFAVLLVFLISCPTERRMTWESGMFCRPIVC